MSTTAAERREGWWTMQPFDDRKGIEAATLLILAALLAIFGAGARLLRESKNAPAFARSIGNLMVSIFSAWLVGLALWETMGEQHPELLLAMSGAAAWLGGDVIDRIARWLLRGVTNGNGKHDSENK